MADRPGLAEAGSLVGKREIVFAQIRLGFETFNVDLWPVWDTVFS